MFRGFQGFDRFCCASILPDDGVVNRAPSVSFPQNCCFSLVGDAYRHDLVGCDADAMQGLFSRAELGFPNPVRIVFNPPRLRKHLFELTLDHGNNSARVIEQNCSRASGSLV